MLAEQAGVPVAPWSGGPVEGLEDGRRHAAAIGYPLIVKSRSGGGGRGIRIVRSEAELEEALSRTRAETERTFGDPTSATTRSLPPSPIFLNNAFGRQLVVASAEEKRALNGLGYTFWRMETLVELLRTEAEDSA